MSLPERSPSAHPPVTVSYGGEALELMDVVSEGGPPD
jgi:hypothetical protein